MKATSLGSPITPLEMDRLRYFGGTTNHWGGACRPFDAIDFEGWPFRAAMFWNPTTAARRKFASSAPTLTSPKIGRPKRRVPSISVLAPAFGAACTSISPPTRFGEVYRQDLEAANNVSVYLNANLVNIETNDNASEVTGLALACLNGRRFRARARYYVLAAGGIEIPRLLLNSDKVQKGGLGNGHDLVGRYFMDHAQPANVATILFTEPQSQTGVLPSAYRARAEGVGLSRPTPELRRAEGLPAFAIAITPGSPPDTDFAKPSLLTVYRSLMSGHIPDHLMFHASNIWTGVEYACAAVPATNKLRTREFLDQLHRRVPARS